MNLLYWYKSTDTDRPSAAGQTAEGGPRGGLGALGAQFTCFTGKKVQILTGTKVQILRRTGGIRQTHGRSGTSSQRGQGRSQHLLDGVGWHRQVLRSRPHTLVAC